MVIIAFPPVFRKPIDIFNFSLYCLKNNLLIKLYLFSMNYYA